MSPWIDEPKRHRHLDLDAHRADRLHTNVGAAISLNTSGLKFMYIIK